MDAREAEADTPLPCLCAMMPAKWISCWNGYSNKCANDVTKQQASLDDTSVAGSEQSPHQLRKRSQVGSETV
eukprot:scaffold255294_cov19-Tisochrysis_lutea.AAC.1